MNQNNNNVINKIDKVKEEIIEEVTKLIQEEKENLNLDQIKNDMLKRVAYIVEGSKFSRQEDLILDIVDDKTKSVFQALDNSFDRKGNCITSTLNDELNNVQNEYTTDKDYDISQGLNETLKRSLNNYDDERNDSKRSVTREMQNGGFDSHRSVIYETVRRELLKRGIYDENYIDDIIVQIDHTTKNSLGEAYDSYRRVDSRLAKQIEDVCIDQIRNLSNKIEKEEKVNEGENKNNSSFFEELKGSMNSSEEIAKGDAETSDRNENERLNEKNAPSLPSDLFK